MHSLKSLELRRLDPELTSIEFDAGGSSHEATSLLSNRQTLVLDGPEQAKSADDCAVDAGADSFTVEDADDGPGTERVVVHADVRGTIPNEDDPDMPYNTLRAWLISICAALGLSGAIFYFDLRTNFGDASVFLGAVLIQPLAYGVGNLMALMPYPQHWPMASFINPGPFNLKEHAYVLVFALSTRLVIARMQS